MADRLRPVQLTDLLTISNRDGWQGTTLAMMQAQVTQGLGWTLEVDQTPIACAGILPLWPGVGHAWGVVSPEAAQHTKTMVFYCRRVLRDIQRHGLFHRIETVAVASSPRNRRFLEALGFAVEQNGVARQYLAMRQDVVRYEWVTACPN